MRTKIVLEKTQRSDYLFQRQPQPTNQPTNQATTTMKTTNRPTYKFTVPPTRNVGSYSGTCSATYGETYQQNALSDYNSVRAHDGLAPLKRMPAGTVYHLPAPTYYVNRTGQGYRETVDEFTDLKEAKRCLTEYRISDPSGSYKLSSRPCKGWND